ncbi:S41 family peptidase [Flavobacterium aquicola]|uniref:C-terminal processing protease CtpA/Prc n=1 Tax=Flavobacterium aquicola TaxID=1682742 RepID=A0A3E0ETN0_9FLAO|nr:S41 family peptidase [Flavobacterium aquicola]REH01144.1 C-terminal processing protease CtpA/Prc [Flavobacterium aquicola]
MKKIFFLLLFVITQSTISSNNLTENQKLATICKVWGFLKYYHPNVADGSKNWDEQLFTILPQIEKAQTKEEFSLVLENWIASQGEIKEYEANKPDSKVEYFTKNLDLKWLEDSKVFSKTLSKKLKFIEKNRFQGKQYYYTSNPYIKVTNEIKYADFKWTNKNLRLLALYRYWNQIEYFFPYKYKMDEKWDVVLTQMLPRFINPESEKDFVLAMREISIKLNDTHSHTTSRLMFEGMFGSKFLPINIKIIDKKVIIASLLNDSIAKVDDLVVGDIITKVDGKTIDEIIDAKKNIVEGSNDAAIRKNFNLHIFSGNTNTIEIEFIRNEKTATKIVKRYAYQDLKIQFPEKEKWKLLEGNIGYIDVESITAAELPNVMQQFKNTKAIIFDARFYPQEDAIEYDIAGYLYPQNQVFAKCINPDLTCPGRYIWMEDHNTGKTNPDYFKGQVIILQNEKTQSHGEHLVMCLQAAPNAVVIGSQTAGADGGICQYEIIKGFTTTYTGYGMFYPNKKETQRIGIVPDIEVKQTIKGIQEDKDEVLDRALQFINKGK